MVIDSNMKSSQMPELDPHQEDQRIGSLKAASKMAEESEPRMTYIESLYPIPVEPSYEQESYQLLTGDMDHSPKILPLENWGTEMEAFESELPLEVEPMLNLEPTPTESRLNNGPSVFMMPQEEEYPNIKETEIRDSDFYHPEYSRPYDYPVPTAYAPKVNVIPTMPEPTPFPMSHPASGVIHQGENEGIEWENDSSIIPVGIYSEKCPIYVVTKTIVVTQDTSLPTGHAHSHNPYGHFAHMPLYAANTHPKPSKDTNENQAEDEDNKDDDEKDDRVSNVADDKNVANQAPSQPIIVVVQNTPQGPSFIPMMPPAMMGSEEIEWSSIFSMDDSQSGSQTLSAASTPAPPTEQSQPQSIPLTQAQPSNPIWNIPTPPNNPFSNGTPSPSAQSETLSQPQLPNTEPSTSAITNSALSALYSAYLQTNQQIVENGMQMQQQQRDQAQQQQSQVATPQLQQQPQSQQQQQLQGQTMESMVSMYQPLPAMQNRAADAQPQPQPQPQNNPTGQLLVASGTDSISYPMWTPQMNSNPNYSTY
jgi:hypothetical protein